MTPNAADEEGQVPTAAHFREAQRKLERCSRSQFPDILAETLGELAFRLNDPNTLPAPLVGTSTELAWRRHRAWLAPLKLLTEGDPEGARRRSASQWVEQIVSGRLRGVELALITREDRRFYEDSGRLLSREDRQASWAKVLPWLDTNRVSPLEFELALVVFDWCESQPTFAVWTGDLPYVLEDAHAFLLRRYSWRLLWHFREADQCGFRKQVGRDQGDDSQRPLVARRRLSLPWFPVARLFGIATVGMISCFAIDSLQHVIWYGPVLPQVALVLGSLFGMYRLALHDVRRQHQRDRSPPDTSNRAFRLCCFLGSVSLAVSLVLTLLLFLPYDVHTFGFWDKDLAALYQFKNPLRPLLGVLDWLCRAATLAALAALLGMMVQWLWDDKSAIERI